ncbi:MAG: hypothetical protein ACXW3Y_11745 [Rhodoplanes sp.]
MLISPPPAYHNAKRSFASWLNSLIHHRGGPCSAASPLRPSPGFLQSLASSLKPTRSFAAIEKYQRAYAAFNQSEEGPDQDAACNVYFDAHIDLHSTEPRTPAGAAKFLRFIADFLDEDDIVNDNWVGDMVGDSIRAAVVVLEREARS